MLSPKSIQRCTLVLAVLLPGGASRASGTQQAAAETRPTATCAAGTALPAKLLEPGSVVLFGEIHGVQEIPSFFGEAVCTAAASGLPVEVGLEVPKDHQAGIDSFLMTPGATSDVESLLSTPFWSRETQDGRSSQAMVALLDRLRRLRAQGLPVHVFAFDLGAGETVTERDKSMGEYIAAHVRAHPAALTMVLVGEVHAWKTQGAPWNPGFLPMGWHLEKAGLRVRSLGRSTPGGTAWVCVGQSASECKTITTKATGGLPSGQGVGIELLPEPSSKGYDGLFGTSSLTASPPAQSSSTRSVPQ